MGSQKDWKQIGNNGKRIDKGYRIRMGQKGQEYMANRQNKDREWIGFHLCEQTMAEGTLRIDNR